MQYNLLICGVGGQGILTLSEILGQAAVAKGLKAIVTVDRGLAQRGGSVKAHIRVGEVYAPMIPKYTAHGLLSLEIRETFGYLDYINRDSAVVVSATHLSSGLNSASAKNEDGDPDWRTTLGQHRPEKLLVVDPASAPPVASRFGVENVYLLGVICGLDRRLEELLSGDSICLGIESGIKRNLAQNLKSFRLGFEEGSKIRE